MLKGVWLLGEGLCAGLVVNRRGRLTALANERARGGLKGDAVDDHIAGRSLLVLVDCTWELVSDVLRYYR